MFSFGPQPLFCVGGVFPLIPLSCLALECGRRSIQDLRAIQQKVGFGKGVVDLVGLAGFIPGWRISSVALRTVATLPVQAARRLWRMPPISRATQQPI